MKEKENQKAKLSGKQLARVRMRQQKILDKKLILLDKMKQKEKYKQWEQQQRKDHFKQKYQDVGSKLTHPTKAV